jgi:hypothetical protein
MLHPPEMSPFCGPHHQLKYSTRTFRQARNLDVLTRQSIRVCWGWARFSHRQPGVGERGASERYRTENMERDS